MMNKKMVSIHIGQAYASKRPVIIYTLLGSCVAVCLYDLKNRMGGMNHIFLPDQSRINSAGEGAAFRRNAMEHLMKEIDNIGCDRRNLVAKAFGGANLISNVTGEFRVGSKNVDYAINYLEKEKIPVVGWDFGGDTSRKVYFHTDSGTAFVKRVPSGCNIRTTGT